MIVVRVEFDQPSHPQDLEASVLLNELLERSIDRFAFGSKAAQLFGFVKQGIVDHQVCGHKPFYTL